MLGDVDCVDERNEVDEKYQFLILGNVEIPYENAKVMNWDDGYQFLILGNVEKDYRRRQYFCYNVSIPNIR